MKLSLIVPWRTGTDTAHRERVWTYIAPLWENEDVEIVMGQADEWPWSKGTAWRRGLDASHGELVCLMDADCWVPRLQEAAELVRQGARWAQGQNVVMRFDPKTTKEMLDGSLSFEQAIHLGDPFEEEPRSSSAGVGTILRREDAYDIPLDPRFVGWGWEDIAWWEALTTMLGSEARLDSSFCWHWWHPAQPTKSRTNKDNPNWRLYRRYVRARGRPARMDDLLGEISG